jgi:adenylate kinase family enzyme
MKIFILVGFQLSGKSSHGHKLREETGIPMIETGHAVYHELKKRNLEVNHENTSKIINSILSKDPIAFTKIILDSEKVKYESSSILILNGVKSPAEIKYVKNKYGKDNVFVLGFHASQKTRFSRVSNADRFTVSGKFHEKTQEDNDLAQWNNFISRDLREINLGIGNALAIANEFILTENKDWPFFPFYKSYPVFKKYILSNGN